MMKVGGVSLAPFFVLSPATFFKRPCLYTSNLPFTVSINLELLFNGLLLWFVGAELETLWGRRKYLFFLLFSQLLAGILFLTIAGFINGLGPASLTSLHGLSQAMILAYGVIFPDRFFSFMFIFPVKAKYFCLIIVAIETYMAFIGQGEWEQWAFTADGDGICCYASHD